ncbi:MAG: bifunctional riboflavin kinase/FMN adenylyltransferase [Chloroflexi bacterium]|nr:bifunctional riboflavin kinase/FMN adenylyltransferase [Chloroflexota bacterium]
MTARGLDELPTIGPAVVTLGAFDGVHLGHRQVVAATAAAARDRDAASVALVFSPHPDEVVRPGTIVQRLLPPEVTLERLEEAGIDHAVEIRFDDALRSLEPEAFLAGLGPALELRAVAMTPTSAFGRNRAGTLERVAEIGATEGFDAVTVEPLIVDGVPVSSSRIRDLLRAGDVGAAAALLGSAPLLRGRVVHGDRRGRELGFPTANMAFDYSAALPALGIYLGRVSVAERGVGPDHPALVSVGVRPTFHDDGRVLVEAYLLDWDGNLYDAAMDVELDDRLREERRFESVEALVAQMRADEAGARRRLGR